MILIALAQWCEKVSYRWQLEVEGHKNELNAKLAVKNAQAKRELVDQLNREADDIEANIKRDEQTDEYKALRGKEKYDADQEKKDAQKIADEKRGLAAKEAANVSGGEQTAQYLRGIAANSRQTADKIRHL